MLVSDTAATDHPTDPTHSDHNESSSNPQRAVKIVLLGDQGVGKTSLRCQFLYHYFSSTYRATIGADFLMHRMKSSDGTIVDLQIWDTAGQERFNAVSKAFYRGSDIGVIVYDITNSESFYHLAKWLDNFVANCGGSKPFIMIVGNKLDHDTTRQISMRQAVEFATSQIEEGLMQDVKLDVIEVSAKNKTQVNGLFQRCAELAALKLKNDDLMPISFDSVDVASEMPEQRHGCC